MALSEEPLTVSISIPFTAPDDAAIAYKVLLIDYHGEGVVKKHLSLQDNVVKAEFTGKDVKREEVIMEGGGESGEILEEEILSGPQPTPSRAKYGFTLYLGSTGGFVLYIIWAVVPKLETGGLDFAIPSRYWAVALPIWVLVTVAVAIFLFYPAINALMAPDPSSPEALSDSYSKPMPQGKPKKIPHIYDMSPAVVSRLLYLTDPPASTDGYS